MKPDFEWWKRPESYVDTSPPLSDDEKAAEFQRVLDASNDSDAASQALCIAGDLVYRRGDRASVWIAFLCERKCYRKASIFEVFKNWLRGNSNPWRVKIREPKDVIEELIGGGLVKS